jgi:hypothetical protein
VNYGVRKRWYLQHLRFWNDYLTRHQINLFLSAWVPHEIPDIIIYELCRRRNIPIVYFGITSITDTSFIEHHWEEAGPCIQSHYEKLLTQYSPDTDPLSISLEERFDLRYKGLVRPIGEIPALEQQELDFSYLTGVKRLIAKAPARFLHYGFQYCTPRGLLRAWEGFERWRRTARTQAFYEAHATVPDLQQPFVYMPLSFQPEATTVPLAGAFADQILIAQLLHKVLPPDVLIYVKEHPRQSSPEKRSPEYYREFLAIPRVRLMPRATNTFILRENCQAIVVTAGTAGFEGPFRGKPVLMFGHCYYQYAKGVYRIRSTEDCTHAVDEIFVKGKKPTLLQARLYLKALQDTCVHGVLDPWCFNISKLTLEENAQNCSRAILADLELVFPTR